MTRTPRRLAAVALALPVALTLAGCGGSQAGAAAVVGDRRIPVSEVQDAHRDVSVLTGPDAGLSQADVLNWLILEPFIVEAAAENGLGVSAHDAELEFASVRNRLAEPSPAAVDVVRTAVALQRLQSGQLPPEQVQRVFLGVIEEIKAQDPQINPRYGGAYDFDRLTLGQVTPNWLPSAPESAEPVPAP